MLNSKDKNITNIEDLSGVSKDSIFKFLSDLLESNVR